MKTVIIAILIGVILIIAVAGIWYYKTIFYIPDKDGMVFEQNDTNISRSYPDGDSNTKSKEMINLVNNS